MLQTEAQYRQVIQLCKEVFQKKNKDYGTAWRILRLPSITDQIFIKAQRIRTLQERGTQRVEEGVVPEFMGIINYCVMALIQIELQGFPQKEFSDEELSILYDQQVNGVMELLF